MEGGLLPREGFPSSWFCLAYVPPCPGPTSALLGNNFALPMKRLNFLKGFSSSIGWLVEVGWGLWSKFFGWKNIKVIKD